MPALLLTSGFPVTNSGGSEGLGKGIDTATGFTVTPNGTVNTPAQIRTQIETALAANASTLFIAQLWRQPNAF
jgi:hypothetical protein